jgi:hypothetical protein
MLNIGALAEALAASENGWVDRALLLAHSASKW